MMFNTQIDITEPFRCKQMFFETITGNALIIEEDYVSYMLIKEAVEGLGLNYKRVFSIGAAIKVLNLNEKFDLIVLNHSLSRGKVKLMKQVKRYYSTPVLAVGENIQHNAQFQYNMDWYDCAVSGVSEVEVQEAILGLL
jgi:CheY-like chemotaxis protein